MNTPSEGHAENVVPLPTPKRLQSARPADLRQRFTLQEFTNRGGSVAWRVSGRTRAGVRIRENYADQRAAEMRRTELEVEDLTADTGTAMRSTRLSHEQVMLCEAAVARMGNDWSRLLDAVDDWQRVGKHATVADEVPRLDKAVEQFTAWVDATPTLRDRTKRNLRLRVTMFAAGTANHRVSDIRPEHVEEFLGKRSVSYVTRDNDRRTLTRFFAWCAQRPRRWCTSNPAREVRVERPHDIQPPAILTVDEARAIMDSARRHKDGILVPYIALCLFGGLRPFEAARLGWEQILLDDAEIRIEGHQSKTRRARTVPVCPTLAAWLRAYKKKPILPKNFRKHFDAVKLGAGFAGRATQSEGLKPWKEDVLRHSAISYRFRQTGSYGLVAELAGNSESIIKRFYQGRVSSADAVKFYAILPRRTAKGKATK